jgi:hypothetical protein
MDITHIYHGGMKPCDIAYALISFFNQGPYKVFQFDRDPQIDIKIIGRQFEFTSAQTAVSISLHGVEGGVSVLHR